MSHPEVWHPETRATVKAAAGGAIVGVAQMLVDQGEHLVDPAQWAGIARFPEHYVDDLIDSLEDLEGWARSVRFAVHSAQGAAA